MIFGNHGLLGINARNLLYIRPYNKKKAIRLADDKIKTKQFLSTRDIPVPKLFGIIRSVDELEKFDLNTLPSSFVIKPNHGYGGEGIIPIVGKKDKHWISAGGKTLGKAEIIEHIRDILDGRYSISNIGDSAFFEQYVISDDSVGKYSFEGLPDIRVVVHNLIPVMAMLRIPTKESKGKANLHLGAVGVGIDISKGETTHISYKNRIIDELPDNLGSIKGQKIPFWDEILLIASKTQLITNLGYMAVDISIDKNTGPVILEINARAGLGVQIANLAPLRRRLERIEGVKVTNPVKGVRIAKDMFGHTVEKEIAHLSGKEVIGTEEEVELIQKNGVTKVIAKVDTGENRTILDEGLAEKAGLLENTEDYQDETSTLKLKFSIRGKRLQTVVDIEKIAEGKPKMVIGKRDLSGFLVDSSQTKNDTTIPATSEIKTETVKPPKGTNYRGIDQKIIRIDNKIKLLYHLRPINLEEEQKKFKKDNTYNPQFKYPKLKFDPVELVDELNKIETDDSVLGKLFEAKIQEILKKVELVDSIGEDNFSKVSVRLFGEPSKKDVEECKALIEALEMKKSKIEKSIYNAEEAKERFEKTFEKYGLKNWKVKIKESMVANCVAGKNSRLFVKEDAKFSRERIESLIVHEIETHILTAENGKMQPYEIFNRGLADYLTTQEGLAMYNVEKQRHTPFKKNYMALAHVIAISTAQKKSFAEVHAELIKIGIPSEQAFRSSLKAKRGIENTSQKGAFTKDYIYYEGYKHISEFAKNGGDLKDLYVGKMNIRDVEKIKEIPGIVSPKILPTWLDN